MKKPTFTVAADGSIFGGHVYVGREVDAYIDELFLDAVKVTCCQEPEYKTWFASGSGYASATDTHTALLINIKPIDKTVCKHETSYTRTEYYEDGYMECKCTNCGKNLKAKWEVNE